MTAATTQSLDSHERAARLLSQAGFAGPFALRPVHGGANSKAFRVDLDNGGPPLFFKEYFRHPHDPRDRLGTEFAFASFAWDQGLRSLARPHAMNRQHGCALYAFLDGRKLTPVEVTADAVGQCLAFFRDINAHKDSSSAADLPSASEACFCLDDHWDCLSRRLLRLAAIVPTNAVARQTRAFVADQLAPAASEYLAWARALAGDLGLICGAPIDAADRCLSPSDFGFHNALQADDGTLSFLDFEYAGWDDPAKTVCDFFCQPACPAPLHFWNEFAAEIAAATSDPARSMCRFTLLWPMYRLKWCCIMLNDFLPAGAGRRQFANRDLDESNRQERQLKKAQDALKQFRAAWSPNVAA
jgi:hypothetical protein